MMAIVPHVTSGLGLRKFQADGFLLTRVYIACLVISDTGSVYCAVQTESSIKILRGDKCAFKQYRLLVHKKLKNKTSYVSF